MESTVYYTPTAHPYHSRKKCECREGFAATSCLFWLINGNLLGMRYRSAPLPIRKWALSIALLLTSILAVACGTSLSIPTPTSTPAPRSITVTGSGKVYLTPDMATISIGVHNGDENAARAVEDAQVKAEELAQAAGVA